jgi:hypothetical protein
MKYSCTLIASLLLVTSIFAQVPQAFSFQGLSVNAAGQPNKDKIITVQIKILKGSATGQEVYKEAHLVTTNSNGLYTISVGKGTVQNGKFSSINWGSPPYFLNVGIDDNTTSGFVNAGTTELLSVPYALYAENANIKPKIVVQNVLPNQNPTLYKLGNGTPASIFYYYEWIQGDPEDVIVDFVGLPDNVSISTFARGGFGLTTPIISTTKTDTIKRGVMVPSSQFKITSPDLSSPAIGSYPIKLRFRTKSMLLDSINIRLNVTNSEFDACFSSLSITLNKDTSTCSDFDSLLVKKVVLSVGEFNFLNVTNLFDQTRTDDMHVNLADCSGNIYSGNVISNGSITLLNYRGYYKDKRITFELIYIKNQQSKKCTVSYD